MALNEMAPAPNCIPTWGRQASSGGFKHTAMRIYGRWGDGKIKHQKGWLLNLIPSAIFIVVAIGCADRALKNHCCVQIMAVLSTNI